MPLVLRSVIRAATAAARLGRVTESEMKVALDSVPVGVAHPVAGERVRVAPVDGLVVTRTPAPVIDIISLSLLNQM